MIVDSNTYLVLTPRARGAVATIRIAGRDLAQRLATVFLPRSGSRLDRFDQNTMIYGDWKQGTSSTEDLVICPIEDNLAEIHCHGGSAAINSICKSLQELGFNSATDADATEIMQLSPWAHEVAIAMGKSTTAKTAAILLEQFNQSDQRLNQLKIRTESNPIEAAKEITECLGWLEFGVHLTKPWSIVLCGEPNVGKSSLINALVGFERVIVHDTPGTTRDVVAQRTALEGWPVELKDTAGLRDSNDQIEQQGIQFAKTEIEQADLVVQVIDASKLQSGQSGFQAQGSGPSVEPQHGHEQVLKSPAEQDLWVHSLGIQPDLLVLNKIDALRQSNQGVEKILSPIQHISDCDQFIFPIFDNLEIPVVQTSALTGAGLQQLVSTIAARLVPTLPPSNILIPINDTTAGILSAISASR